VDAKTKALMVITRDKKIVAWLKKNDPQALKQCLAALEPAGPCVCVHCGKPAIVDFGDGSGTFSSTCIEGRCVTRRQ
jgi:hypothetical protein